MRDYPQVDPFKALVLMGAILFSLLALSAIAGLIIWIVR